MITGSSKEDMKMTVLTRLIKEREEWANRHRVIAQHQQHITVIRDYIMILIMFILPYLVYIFRDKVGKLINLLP
jgi:hypothetical protein